MRYLFTIGLALMLCDCSAIRNHIEANNEARNLVLTCRAWDAASRAATNPTEAQSKQKTAQQCWGQVLAEQQRRTSMWRRLEAAAAQTDYMPPPLPNPDAYKLHVQPLAPTVVGAFNPVPPPPPPPRHCIGVVPVPSNINVAMPCPTPLTAPPWTQ